MTDEKKPESEWLKNKCPVCGFYPRLDADGKMEEHYAIVPFEGSFRRMTCMGSGKSPGSGV